MSIFSGLKNLFSGSSENSASKVVDRPVSNCPSDCTIAGTACSVCEPYKKKLIDKLYYVDHLEEFLSRYEVVGEGTEGSVGAAGTTACPFCGAPNTNPEVCEFCGTRLTDAAVSSKKIKVAAASDIPNPIMEAQDVIYERYETVIKQYTKSSSSSDGILSELISAISGNTASDTDEGLGAKMSEAEIKEAASLYGVSVSDYLTGLDNGKYLTLAGRKEAASIGNAADYTPVGAGVSGVAGIGLLAGALLGRNKRTGAHHDAPPQRPPMDNMQHHDMGRRKADEHMQSTYRDSRRQPGMTDIRQDHIRPGMGNSRPDTGRPGMNQTGRDYGGSQRGGGHPDKSQRGGGGRRPGR